MAVKTSIQELKKKFYEVGSRLRWFDHPIDIILLKIKRELQAKELPAITREEKSDNDSNVKESCATLSYDLQNVFYNNISPIKCGKNEVNCIVNDDGNCTNKEDEYKEDVPMFVNSKDEFHTRERFLSPLSIHPTNLKKKVSPKHDPNSSSGSDSDDLDSFLDKIRTPKPIPWKDLTEDSPSNSIDNFIVDDDDCFVEDQNQNDFEEVFIEDNSDEDDKETFKDLDPICTPQGDDDDKENFKTPLPTPGQRSKTSSNNIFKTPIDKTKTLDQLRRPRSALESITTPYSNQNIFKKNKDVLVKELFQLYNSTVFENQLPSDMSVTWNKKLRCTAGYCYYGRKNGTTTARIELADKVIDSSDRLRDTLIHEMCHAAAWLINNVRAGHGPVWKKWAKRANSIHHDLPPISRCHSYKINAKFIYRCTNEFCSNSIGRHSKSLNLDKYRCAYCHSRFELQPQLKKDGTPQSARTPNKFALFVKDNYSKVKKNGMQHKDVMKELSSQFSALSAK